MVRPGYALPFMLFDIRTTGRLKPPASARLYRSTMKRLARQRRYDLHGVKSHVDNRLFARGHDAAAYAMTRPHRVDEKGANSRCVVPRVEHRVLLRSAAVAAVKGTPPAPPTAAHNLATQLGDKYVPSRMSCRSTPTRPQGSTNLRGGVEWGLQRTKPTADERLKCRGHHPPVPGVEPVSCSCSCERRIRHEANVVVQCRASHPR